MTWELKRVEPLRAANIGALVYGIMMTIFAMIAAPFFILVALIAPDMESGMAVFLILLYPILGLVMGWISGLLTAAIYNLVIRLTGGLLFTMDTQGAPPAAAS